MKKIQLLLIALIIGIGFQSCNKVPEQFAASDKYRLVWNSDPTSTLTIAWDQIDSVSNPVILYGEADHGREFWKYKNEQVAGRVFKYYEMNTHFAKLTGLKENTAYYFVVKDEQGVSERYWFKTAPDTPQPFTFIAGGDTKSEGNALKASQNSNRVVAKLRPLFVLFNGDFNSGSGLDANRWKQWLTDWQKMTTTTDGRMIPIVPIHGNHENGDRGNLNHIFNSPYQENDSSQIYYDLSFGGDFFYMLQLNSEIIVGGKQKEWLEENLGKHKDYTFKIAGYHKPFWPHTSGKRENQHQYDQWANIFYENRLSLSFDADSHMHKVTYPLVPDTTENSFMGFIRDDVNGTMFAGEGSWGASPRRIDDDKPWTLTSGSFNQIKWIHVHPKSEKEDAHMKMFTVLTANYDEKNEIINYNQEIEPLTEDNLFEVPENIVLHETEKDGKFIRFPYLGE